MKAFRPSDLHALLAAYGVRPRKSLGQNFLIDGNMRRIIIETAELEGNEPVLEIGPGAGVLTEALLAGGRRVVAIEKDSRLAALLRARFSDFPGFRLTEGDALDADLDAVFRTGIRTVLSNLPYAQGTRILVALLFSEPPPQRMVITLQTEVAERIVAPVGTSAYGLLAIWSGWRYRARIQRTLSPRCFYPAPDVQSSLVRLERLAKPAVDLRDPAHFRGLTRWAFMHRRKQMQTLFRRLPSEWGLMEEPAAEWLERSGIPPAARPEDLDVVAWGNVSNRL